MSQISIPSNILPPELVKFLLKHPYAYGTLSAVIIQLLRSLWDQYRSRPKGCPGPFELPILGNSLIVVKRASSILDYLYELGDKYGDTFTLKVWGQPRFIATSNPLNVEFILKKDFESFEKGPVFRDRFTELLGNGIFNADGDLWYNQRKTAVHMFTAGRFRDLMMTVFSRNADKLVEILRSQRDLGKAVDVQDLMYRYTLDSIGHIGFGEDLGSLQTANLPFAIAFDTAQQIVCDRFFSICWPLRKVFHPDEWKFRKALNILNKKAYEMVEERLKLSVEELESRHDFLTMFARVRDETGKPLYSKEFLRDVVLNFLIAGRDTTAGALTWGIWRLSEHPNIRKRLVEEINQVMKETGEGLDKPWSYDTLRKGPPYLHAFVHEVLRLHPSVPKDGKTILRDTVLPTGVKATKGSFMVYMPWSMGRSEKIWGADAKEFKPERWLETDSNGSIGDLPYKLKPKPSQYEFIAFNAGPRLCLGQEMAFLEIKLVLVTLAKYFLLEKVPDHPIQYLSTLTMPMRYGLKMYVRDRPDGKVPLPK